MKDKKAIIEDVKATMAMEGMSLTKEDVKVLEDCLAGRITFDQAVQNAIAEFEAA